jgi:hypothetical protein
MRAAGEQLSDPGSPRAEQALHEEVPDSLACGSASGMTGGEAVTYMTLAPALRLTATAPRSDPVGDASDPTRESTERVPESVPAPGSAPVPSSGPCDLGGGITTLPGIELRIVARLGGAIVTRVRRHRPPPVCALRFQP